MERILVLFLLRFIVTLTNLPQVELQAIGTDCNGKSFICIDRNRFQVCADVPGDRTETTDDVTHVCASDTFCYNDGKVECDSMVPFDEAASFSEVLSETEGGSTTLKNTEVSEMSSLSGSSTISGIFNLNTLTVSTLSASFNVPPELPISTFVPGFIELRLDATAADEQSATFEESQTGDGEPTSTSNNVDETTSSPSAATTSIDSEPHNTSESSIAEQFPESTTVIQPTTTEKRFFCELPGSYPHESNCHKYYVCVQRPYGFIRFELFCYLNMAFDPILHQCVFNQRACHPTRDAFVCPSDGTFPDPSGGRGQYYWCVGNGTDYLMYQMVCPYGLQFNADVGQCQDESGPDVVISSGGMQTVVVNDSEESSSESSVSDDSNE